MKILAREKQVKLLEEIFNSKSPEFLAVYGRRRVGKTYLVKNFFEDRGIFFHITGTPRETARQQLVNFAHVYAEVFNKGEPFPVPESWQDAFHVLRKALKTVKQRKKIILFFDELPWLVTKKSGFLESLTYFWNRYLASDPRVVLIVCGSAASWMINNVINARGGAIQPDNQDDPAAALFPA
ncbi:ATP-binding protein [Fibrobacterota bacterium]